ncbi:MAG: preprotein translocase subunit SecE [Cellulosilyticaceae bacterium]
MVEFFKNFIAESKRIVWPNRKELISKTTSVILFSLLAAGIVFVMDTVFGTLINILAGLPL